MPVTFEPTSEASVREGPRLGCSLDVSTVRTTTQIVHCTVLCLVSRPLNKSEAKVDLTIIQTLPLLK